MIHKASAYIQQGKKTQAKTLLNTINSDKADINVKVEALLNSL